MHHIHRCSNQLEPTWESELHGGLVWIACHACMYVHNFQEMAACIERCMRGGDTPCHMGIVTDTHEWYAFFTPMRFMIHGFAISDAEAAMNHSLRFIRRADLNAYLVKGNAYTYDTHEARFPPRMPFCTFVNTC